MRLPLSLALIAALLAPPVAAQTVTITSPNTVNQNGQPVGVTNVFVRRADGTIADLTGGGSGGGGDASAANQTTQITTEQAIRDRIGDITAPAAGTVNARLATISTLNGATYRSTTSVLTNGTTQTPNTDARGNLFVQPVLTQFTATDSGGIGMTSYGRYVNSTNPAANVFAISGLPTQYDPVANTTYFARGDAFGSYAVDTPTSSASSAIVPGTALNAVSLVLKASAGNFYGATLTAGTAAGFLVVANLTAAPASGTTLTAAQVIYCVPVAASGVATAGSAAGLPDRMTTGATLLFSTSCSTYTPVATAAVHLRGRAF